MAAMPKDKEADIARRIEQGKQRQKLDTLKVGVVGA